ncbi:endonuclease/exonuclease/phosphatase family protein [Trifolium medium]|uniref:Endonuclease/exonuclease/phosphatase family protein n=1 Tax=Trifolium medium TaxID=97028 RepID=A0A392LWP5_9FABA|nr:endonuclease/exonuclease/phosphatase family protein [Trifolium medium]
MHKPVMIVIVETRCDPTKLRRTFQLLGYEGFVASEVNGYAGGIIVAWKEDSINVQLGMKKFQFLHMRVQLLNKQQWFFTAIYASPNEENRRTMWEDLKNIADSMNCPWLLAGDFNDIACAAGKKGGAPVSIRRCNLFKDRINACNLLDLGAVGSKYTWRGPIYHGGQRIYERLDRALSNDMWRLLFPEAFVKILARLDYSDHHPILINLTDTPHPVAPRQFGFESAWLIDDSYQGL